MAPGVTPPSSPPCIRTHVKVCVEGRGKASACSSHKRADHHHHPPAAQASPPNTRHQKLLHLRVLGSNTWANGSWITSSLFHVPPRPSHPPANPVGCTLKLHPEPDCILPLPCADLLPAQSLQGAGQRWGLAVGALEPGSCPSSLGLGVFICRKGGTEDHRCFMLKF